MTTTNETLIITGASGALGRQVAELALERTDPSRVVLVTRRPETFAELAAKGADVRHGDFDDPATLATAFAGGTRLLLISTDTLEHRADQHRAAVDAARAAGVQHVTYTSIPNPVEANTAAVVPSHRATEELLRGSGLKWTILRNSLYSDFLVPDAQGAVARGAHVHNRGDGEVAYVAREDCAAVAAAVLLGGAEHDDQVYDVTGSERLSGAELAPIFGAWGSTTVEAVAVDDDAFSSALTDAGLPPEAVTVLTSFGQPVRDGYLDVQSDVVERLAGRPPRTVAEILTAAGRPS